MGAAREHGVIDPLTAAEIPTVADTRLSGRRSEGGRSAAAPAPGPDVGLYRRLSRNQKDVNAAHAHRRGPGERVNAELKNWRILRKVRSSPSRVAELVAAVQILMIANP